MSSARTLAGYKMSRRRKMFAVDGRTSVSTLRVISAPPGQIRLVHKFYPLETRWNSEHRPLLIEKKVTTDLLPSRCECWRVWVVELREQIRNEHKNERRKSGAGQ